MALSDDDVREILRIIDESELDELQIETRGFRLHVLRGEAAAEAPSPVPSPAPAPEPSPAPQQPDSTAPGGPAKTIEAPMLGTFYAADGPSEDPFVEVGQRVEPETVVGIIEVMKMMNSVRAGVAGTIAEVCAENGEMVEEGAPLFRVSPA
jgi:acetyl-CoA carboxylase biotin carboxyl carrier protein